MSKVICDTNIWYDIGEGEILINSSTPDLYCTHLTLFELIHSEYLKTNFIKVQNACRSVLTYNKGFILEPPITHLYNLSKPNDLKVSERSFFNAIEYLASIEKLDIDIIEELEKYLIIKNNTLASDFTSHINEEVNKAKTEIFKNKINTNRFKQMTKRNDIKEERLKNLKKQIINDIKNQFPYSDNKQFNESFWIQINFYVNARLKYFEKLKMDRKMQSQQNDAIDLMNLIYVNKDFLYWTRDARWKNIFIEARLESYIFDCNLFEQGKNCY